MRSVLVVLTAFTSSLAAQEVASPARQITPEAVSQAPVGEATMLRRVAEPAPAPPSVKFEPLARALEASLGTNGPRFDVYLDNVSIGPAGTVYANFKTQIRVRSMTMVPNGRYSIGLTVGNILGTYTVTVNAREYRKSLGPVFTSCTLQKVSEQICFMPLTVTDGVFDVYVFLEITGSGTTPILKSVSLTAE